MKINKEVLKVLSMSFLLTSLVVTSPVVTTVIHAAGTHGEGGGIRPNDKRDEEERKKREEEEKRKEDAKKKANEERMKEIAQRVVKTEVKDEGAAREEVTEKLLKNLPSEILEMYDKVGGKFKIADGKLGEHPDLKDLKLIDKDGKEVSLANRFVYAKEGKEPVLFIEASTDYEESIGKKREVYSEIGKSLVQDVLRPETIVNPAFINSLNKMKSNEDGMFLLFPSSLIEHTGPFDEKYVKENLEKFQKVFVNVFSHYQVEEYRDALKNYAPEMFEYMEKLNWNELKEQIRENKTGALDFKEDAAAAQEFGRKIKIPESELTDLDKKSMERYVFQGPLLNRILREIEPHPKGDAGKAIDEFIKGIDNLFTKEEAKLPNDVIVYRRTDEREFGFKPGTLFNQDGDINQKAVEKLKSFEGKTITDKGYMSTSLAINSVPLGGNQETVRLRMKIPTGTPAIYMDNSWYEVVLNRNSSYKITKVNGIIAEGSKIVVNIEVELIPNS
uniref:Putative insecticidal protein n=1 Tax=Bacillus thuringiensis TaxID=1428 RepID=A0A7M1VJM6_BACTU|nr:putative insecticidal protein [Bacillus thuringiensis]